MTPERVLGFWLDEVGPTGWYSSDSELDDKIRREFLSTWERISEGGHSMWLTYPSGSLAYLIVCDQFSRNMFRQDAKSFHLDRVARAAAKQAIRHKFDLKIDEPARQFFYMPLMHSECISDQEQCVRLFLERMPQTCSDFLPHVQTHREIIRKFGRFPYRNDALNRKYTAPEREFLAKGGYGMTLNQFATASVA